jgi:hypothetical protein
LQEAAGPPAGLVVLGQVAAGLAHQPDGGVLDRLAQQRAPAAMAADPPVRHDRAAALVALVADADWQQAHQAALQDLPALRDALAAAVADDSPAGVPLLMTASHTLLRFREEHQRAGPMFELARLGDLAGARRRCSLFTLDPHWRQALLLTVAWLAPPALHAEAVELFNEVVAGAASGRVANGSAERGVDGAVDDATDGSVYAATKRTLRALAGWVHADLFGTPPPQRPETVPPARTTDYLVEQLLNRLGGTGHDGERLQSVGIGALAQYPNLPTRGLAPSGPVMSGVSGTSGTSGAPGPTARRGCATRWSASCTPLWAAATSSSRTAWR